MEGKKKQPRCFASQYRLSPAIVSFVVQLWMKKTSSPGVCGSQSRLCLNEQKLQASQGCVQASQGFEFQPIKAVLSATRGFYFKPLQTSLPVELHASVAHLLKLLGHRCGTCL